MTEASEIVLVLIQQIPCISIATVLCMAIKHGFKHISFKHNKIEIQLDK